MKLAKTMRTCLLLTACFAVPLLAQKGNIESLSNPAGDGSLQPNWSTAYDGSTILSWVETAKDGSLSLRYATLKGSTWSAPHTVAEHRHFFRHPAEVPEVFAMGEGALARPLGRDAKRSE